MATNGNHNVVTIGGEPPQTVVTLPEHILAAIAESHVAHVVSAVKISPKASPTKKEESASYDQLDAQDAEGMAALCAGKLELQTPTPTEGDDDRTPEQKRLGAANHFNYGYDLARRAKCRAKLVTRLEGPEKAIEKGVKALMDSDAYDNEDEARAHIISRRKARADAAKAAEEVEDETGEATDNA